MSLEFILLGMLHEPAAGYDLKREFNEGTRYFWAAELSQIYPTLEKMERRGLLASRSEPSPRGPARRVYRRTAKGTRALCDWIRSGPVMGHERFAYIAQLIYLHELDDLRATLTFLRQLRDELAAYLDVLLSAQREVEKNDRTGARESQQSSLDFHTALSLKIGVGSLEAKVDGCDQCIAIVQDRLKKGPRHVRRA